MRMLIFFFVIGVFFCGFMLKSLRNDLVENVSRLMIGEMILVNVFISGFSVIVICLGLVRLSCFGINLLMMIEYRVILMMISVRVILLVDFLILGMFVIIGVSLVVRFVLVDVLVSILISEMLI